MFQFAIKNISIIFCNNICANIYWKVIVFQPFCRNFLLFSSHIYSNTTRCSGPLPNFRHIRFAWLAWRWISGSLAQSTCYWLPCSTDSFVLPSAVLCFCGEPPCNSLEVVCRVTWSSLCSQTLGRCCAAPVILITVPIRCLKYMASQNHIDIRIRLELRVHTIVRVRLEKRLLNYFFNISYFFKKFLIWLSNQSLR